MDESMLTEPEHMKSDPRGGGGGERGGWRSGQDTFDLPSGSPNLSKKVEAMPPQNMHGGEVRETLGGEDEFTPEEEQSLQDYATDMHKRGDDAEVIDRAMRMARDFLRRHRGHADDVLPSRVDVQDKMPLRAGHFNKPRFGRDFEVVEPPHGLDSSNSSRREINEIRRQMKRLGSEAGCAPERYRGAQDAVPTMARRARTEAKYGLARIEDA
jgi:hypothetical protein